MKNLLNEKKTYEFLIDEEIAGLGRIKDIIIGPYDENIFITNYFQDYISNQEKMNEFLAQFKGELSSYLIFEELTGPGFPFYRLNDFLEDKNEEVSLILSRKQK